MLRSILKLKRRRPGVTSVEYAIMLALMLAVALVAIHSLGVQTHLSWNRSNTKLRSVNFGS
jgi:Flp pilus assembly pilin Flp